MSRITLLYPGALGTPLAALLIRAGHVVTTELTGRSPRTCSNAQFAGMRVAENLPRALEGADMVISLVPADSAEEVAGRCAAAMAGLRPIRRPLYLDANSISPHTVARVADAVGRGGFDCVDAAVVGPANLLGRDTLVLVSGPRAEEVRAVLAPAVAAECLSEALGDASAVKMSLSLVTKALAALAFEMFDAASRGGQYDSLRRVLDRVYPEIAGLLGRNLPTYPMHLHRRLEELDQVRSWMARIGAAGVMVTAARQVLGRLEGAELSPEGDWTTDTLIAAVTESGVLAATP